MESFLRIIYIYMNSTTPKWHAETLRNRKIPFQLKKQNTCRNEIDNLGWRSRHLVSLLLENLLVCESLSKGTSCVRKKRITLSALN